ncbi:MAG: protein-L-isoaspartate O-methyltransferase [Pseudobdellovibrionaceae bacterium]
MTLQNFVRARESMVVSQLQPSGVVAEAVMEAYRTTPRENYVPEAIRGVCYLDDDVALEGGRFLMEPVIHAKMLQDAALTKEDKVLDIGGATGYAAAILAKLAGRVIALDPSDLMLERAQKQWRAEGLGNITAVVGAPTDGYAKEGPYRIIVMNGAVEQVPEALVRNQLAPEGKLYCVVQPDPESVGVITVVHKTAQDVWGTRVLGNATTRYVPGFEPVTKFTL